MQPDDYAAILWVRANTPPDAMFLEAPGTQYQYNSRFATMTGRPSLGGWLYHAWGWRGARFEAQRDARREDARDIYLADGPRKALEILRRTGTQYVVVGALERETYPGLDEAQFSLLGEPVFTEGGTTIYKINPDTDPEALPAPKPRLLSEADLALFDIPTTGTIFIDTDPTTSTVSGGTTTTSDTIVQ